MYAILNPTPTNIACRPFQEIEVTVYPQLTAGTDGNHEFCEGETATQDLFAIFTGEDAGGTWAQTGGTTSLTVGAGTAVDFSSAAPSTYTFTYTHAASGSCPASVSTATVTVTDQLLAGTDGSDEFCEGEAATQDLFAIITGEDAGGTWAQTG